MLHVIEMNSSHKRVRADSDSEDSEEDYANITPMSSTHDVSKDGAKSDTQVAANCRPRRSTATYRAVTHSNVGTVPPARVKKRRYTTALDNTTIQATGQQLPYNEPPRSTSLQILPSETARRPMKQPNAARAVLPEYLMAPSNELHIEDPAQNPSTSVTNLTLRFALPFMETSFTEIPTRVAGSLIDHWRTWTNGSRPGRDTTMQGKDSSIRRQPPTMGPSTIREEIEKATPHRSKVSRSRRSKPISTKRVASDVPTVGDEQSSSSYVNPDTSDSSEESFDEIRKEEEQAPPTRFESPVNDQELQVRTILKEQSPPPQHGHPNRKTAVQTV